VEPPGLGLAPVSEESELVGDSAQAGAQVPDQRQGLAPEWVSARWDPRPDRPGSGPAMVRALAPDLARGWAPAQVSGSVLATAPAAAPGPALGAGAPAKEMDPEWEWAPASGSPAAGDLALGTNWDPRRDPVPVRVPEEVVARVLVVRPVPAQVLPRGELPAQVREPCRVEHSAPLAGGWDKDPERAPEPVAHGARVAV